MSAAHGTPEPTECQGRGVEIAPRAELLGGGWRLRLIDGGIVRQSLIFGDQPGQLGRALEVATRWVQGERAGVEIGIDDDGLTVRRLDELRDIFDPIRRAAD